MGAGHRVTVERGRKSRGKERPCRPAFPKHRASTQGSPRRFHAQDLSFFGRNFSQNKAKTYHPALRKRAPFWPCWPTDAERIIGIRTFRKSMDFELSCKSMEPIGFAPKVSTKQWKPSVQCGAVYWSKSKKDIYKGSEYPLYISCDRWKVERS